MESNMDAITLQRAMSYVPPTLLIEKFCREHKVSEAKARERFEETKKFLVVCASDRSVNFSPNEAVDMMWHAFILCSRDYFRFCELVGGYIHHQPSERHEHERYINTLSALRRTFGKVNGFVWEEKVADCSSCGMCSACSN